MSPSEQRLNDYEQEKESYFGDVMKRKPEEKISQAAFGERERKVVLEAQPRERMKGKASELFSKCEVAGVTLHIQ